MIDPMSVQPRAEREEVAREVESLLWLAAGAVWAVVAVRAWSRVKRIEARKTVFSVSDRLLGQVFPEGIRP